MSQESKSGGKQLIANLNEVAVAYNGDLVKVGKEDSQPLLWKEVIYRSFCQMWPQDQPDKDNKGGLTFEEKKFLSNLNKKIYRAKPEMELSDKELETIKDYVSRLFGIGVYGPIFDMIDDDYQEVK